ncbi:MAG: dUTP diphosphatase [Kiritimatiellia bacterium]
MKVTFQRCREGAVMPSYAHPGDAGMDICSCEAAVIQPDERKLIQTGLMMALPEQTEAQIRPRSGLALKNGITLLNTPGTIDAGYRGELGIIMINLGTEPFVIQPGMRIAQMVIAPVLRVEPVEVHTLSDTARGSGGFGSSGV